MKVKAFNFTHHLLTIGLLLLIMGGCAPKEIVRVDLDTYLTNQQLYQGEEYKNKRVVIATTLKDLNERYEAYRGKIIEVSAPVTYYGKSLFWTWYITVQKDGHKLRCYEDRYRLYPDPLAVNAVLTARTRGDEVTVRGTLYRDGLEMERLIYNGYNIDTNNPFRYRYPRSFGY